MSSMQPTLLNQSCADCGADISHRNRNAKTCESCTKKRRYARARDWRQRNAEYDRERRQRYYKANRERILTDQAARWRVAGPKVRERRRDQVRLAKYGLSRADFEAILASQNNSCAICGTAAPAAHGWHIDHCHIPGRVRGILCHHCNTGIGHLKEDTTLLMCAIHYLAAADTADVANG